jgi:ureidoglycolate dehydrogenase (NAD+)
MLPIENFKYRVDTMIRNLRGSPKAKNSERIYLPGEIEWERREDALKNGIPLPARVLASLQGAASDFGLDIALLETEEVEQ